MTNQFRESGQPHLGYPRWLGPRGTAVLLILPLLLAATTATARAHSRITVERFAVVVGWVTEPPIVGERNALFVEITADGAPVTGVEATLRAEILYGGETFRTNLNPVTAQPGQYTAELVPTVRGQYAVRLFGSIEDIAIDEVIEPEEVFSAARLQFPETQPDTRALQQELRRNTAELEIQLATLRTLTIVAITFGLLGFGLALVIGIRKR